MESGDRYMQASRLKYDCLLFGKTFTPPPPHPKKKGCVKLYNL